MTACGVQVFGDLFECDRAALDDLPRVQAAMLEAARRAGATIVADFAHRFSPHGCSCVVVIAESHLTIHTWPEDGYAAVDLFTCGDTLVPERGFAHLVEVFGSRFHTLTSTRRGTPPGERELASGPSTGPATRTIALVDAGAAGAGGAAGPTAAVVERLAGQLRRHARVTVVHLAEPARAPAALATRMRASDGFAFVADASEGAGPLEQLFAATGGGEAGWTWLGKPAAVVVSTCGAQGPSTSALRTCAQGERKGVPVVRALERGETDRREADEHLLAALQGRLGALGCVLPPMSGLVHLAGAVPDPLDVVAHNLAEAIGGRQAWRTWARGR